MVNGPVVNVWDVVEWNELKYDWEKYIVDFVQLKIAGNHMNHVITVTAFGCFEEVHATFLSTIWGLIPRH